jgi:hypothetical protein
MTQLTPAAGATHPPNGDTDAPPRTILERLLADLAAGHQTVPPTEGAPRPSGASRTWSAQTALLSAYLEAHPAASQALSAQLIDAWAAADGSSGAYLIAVANLHAKVVSHAELHHAIVAAPVAMSDLLESLDEYLVHERGRTVPARE